MKAKTIRKERVNLITLGCSKNLVDSENIITQLKANDIPVTHEDDANDAEVIIVNTCGFIDLAKEESVNTILQYAAAKTRKEIKKLYVTGCLSQRYKDDLALEIPEVDAWFGTMDLPGLLARFNVDYRHELLGERKIATPMHYAYLKISEGCNRTCSFCAIPLMRGKHISRSIEDLVTEARSLARQGVREVMLIAQELTYYGLDLYKDRRLAELMHALSEVEGIDWIRLHYAYPSKFPLDILEAMAVLPKVCNYLDMPLQHADDRVLERMRRQITRAETEELVAKAREIVPGIIMRTTLLVGFPGETEEEFEVLCDFVRRMRFERVGVFQYSHEEDTRAHTLQDDVPAEVKMDRANRIMEIQREISLEKNQTRVGRVERVLIDKLEGGSYYGRSEGDSPEVDNEVVIEASVGYLRVGDFVEVEITSATEYDVYAHPAMTDN
ncbi:MAG: 30S ribosomal protein S12 methylthiotransferase RimO [Saprospiraceae bacterium]|nr:30S ribosomal protein S12 methylthiotransferase RimO [Saprospiraceae bacterium]